MKNILELKNISVTYDGYEALKNINLQIKEKSFTTIIGTNGSGKTTLLKTILNTVKYKGKVERKKDLQIAYIPQNLNIQNNIPITVKEFLNLTHKVDLKKIDIKEEILKKELNELSGGQLQSILITRALEREPNLIIFDEPTKNLDYNQQIKFYNKLEKIYKESKISIIIVSHDLNFVFKLSNHVICLHKSILCKGHPVDICEESTFQDLFKDSLSHLSLYKHKHQKG